MKFNINRPPKQLRKQTKINAKREWHTKFAWLPTSVDETRDKHSKVWFEKYWRQGHYNGVKRSLAFTKYSEKEYFKKKLAGDFDKNEDSNVTADTMSAGTMSAVQSVGRALRSPNPKPLIMVASDTNTGLHKK